MLSTEKAMQIVFDAENGRPEHTDQIAVIQAAGHPDGTDKTVTYADFQKMQDRAVAAFQSLKIEPRDRVLLNCPNSPELAAAIAAIWRMGAVAVPVDFRLTEKEVENVANQVGVKLLCGSSRFNPNLTNSYTHANARKFDLKNLSDDAGFASLDIDSSVVDNAGAARNRPTLDVHAPALVILTSGTTGIPKGAVHDLHTLINNLCQLGPLVDLNYGKKMLVPLPLSHVFGLEVFFAAFLHGSPVIFTELSPQSFFTCAKKYEPQVYIGVPTLYGAMLALPPGSLDLKKAEWVLSGGATLPVSLAQDFEKKYGIRLCNGYGSTESKIIAFNLEGPLDAVGKIIPSVKVTITDENGKALPDGQTGEIHISGSCLMMGYLDNPTATMAVLKDGQYNTGDMGFMKDERLYISGRNKEMIVVAGNKVFPSEVEDVLRSHNLVKEVAVIGIPNKQLGQVVKAVVVLNDDEKSKKLEGDVQTARTARHDLIAELKEFCKQHLKRELRPMEYDFLPSHKALPKTSSGKIDKKALMPATSSS
ncbi:MAG: class I adenylate-forming enzyme family protein [Candidatus Obscuribacterales bacterium]|nr:class I adenylate-forming enzyme family protein [Candidatus Obscuribacterales bacterium]